MTHYLDTMYTIRDKYIVYVNFQVKPDGQILDLMTTLRKDNTGFHLKNFFIGAEGTLGFVTKVGLQCLPRPKFNHVAFLGNL